MKHTDCLNVVTRQINGLFGSREPWQVASITAISLMTALWFWEQIKQDESKYFFCVSYSMVFVFHF